MDCFNRIYDFYRCMYLYSGFDNLEIIMKVLKMSLVEFFLFKFYQLFGISKVKFVVVSVFRISYRLGDRFFIMLFFEYEKMLFFFLEIIVDVLLEIMEVSLGNLLKLYNQVLIL